MGDLFNWRGQTGGIWEVSFSIPSGLKLSLRPGERGFKAKKYSHNKWKYKK